MKEGGSLLPSMLAERIEDSMHALDETEQRHLLSLLNKLRRG